jgi:hypothetical protein
VFARSTTEDRPRADGPRAKILPGERIFRTAGHWTSTIAKFTIAAKIQVTTTIQHGCLIQYRQNDDQAQPADSAQPYEIFP